MRHRVAIFINERAAKAALDKLHSDLPGLSRDVDEIRPFIIRGALQGYHAVNNGFPVLED